MRVVVTGSTGLIGSALVARLEARGDEVIRLRRGTPDPESGDHRWDPASGTVDPRALPGADAVVHLAGAGIGNRRWTASYKEKILRSRTDGTTTVVRALADTADRPAVLVSASAVGWYGANRGDEILTERSEPGDDFLAHVCRAWEATALGAKEVGVRVVTVRNGVVLAAHGGALRRQLPLFRLGLGGRLGSGRQWLSWISLADEVSAILRVVDDASLSGPVNATAPQPVTNAAFTAALSRALQRRAPLPAPAPALRLVLGSEMADELPLADQRVVPARLQEAGFSFAHADIDAGLAAALAPAAAP